MGPFRHATACAFDRRGQWAGKSTVAGILAERHCLTHYHYDYHDARGHLDRRMARQMRRGIIPLEPDAESRWVRSTPERMAEQALEDFVERFASVQDDLRALVSPRPVIAEGGACDRSSWRR
jgi:hypothetical protein